MPICFIISPIGELGSETRKNADDLRDLLIKPIMELYGFTVLRGDHRSDAGQIDIDVIRAIQTADLCIVDLSLPNPNVYYEFGRRDETGKPLILLKSKGSEELPVDVATRRYIEYDLDDRRGLIDARQQIINFLEPLVKRGFEETGTGASLAELSEILRRIERKVDRINKTGTGGGTGTTPPMPPENVDPIELLNYSLRTRNIPMAEQAMDLLSYRMDRNRWLDRVVEQVAAMGSIRAGDILIESAIEFIDTTDSFRSKIEYLGCLVGNLNKTDRELQNLELVETLCRSLNAISANEPVDDRIQVYNQANRLYYGIYSTTEDVLWLHKAIAELKKALELDDKAGFIHYNLATCLKELDEPDALEDALRHALISIEADGEKKDDDHIALVCRLMHDLNDERLMDYLELLESVNAFRAKSLRAKWRI